MQLLKQLNAERFKEERAIIAETRTPMERFVTAMQKLNKVFQRGFLSVETFERKRQQLLRERISAEPSGRFGVLQTGRLSVAGAFGTNPELIELKKLVTTNQVIADKVGSLG